MMMINYTIDFKGHDEEIMRRCELFQNDPCLPHSLYKEFIEHEQDLNADEWIRAKYHVSYDTFIRYLKGEFDDD
jgi:hypothetical protein